MLKSVAVVLEFIQNHLGLPEPPSDVDQLVDLIPVSDIDPRIDPQARLELQQAFEDEWGFDFDIPGVKTGKSNESDDWTTVSDIIQSLQKKMVVTYKPDNTVV